MEKTRDELVSIDEACANCGKRGGGAVKLKNCNACHLVKYCGVECQKAHRKQHKVACKMRAAELKDDLLYSQGHERPEEDFCPICTLPIPLGSVNGLSVFFNTCCTKMICAGRELAAQKRGMFDCPFCRTPQPNNIADTMVMVQARVERGIRLRSTILVNTSARLGILERQSNYGQRLQDLVVVQHSTTLHFLMTTGRGFKRTRLRLRNSTKRRPCKDMSRAGTILVIMREGRGTTIAH